ncbi:hypothetical protein HGP28_10915 [Vibrio sp. SM6]|uniref:Flagellar basal-body/hook protein C-terminal domain-containing protein n=1 Tax=Vibrio agarilyticus TaxID=2726741 RepID=A0A7X8YH60_9VIBR|nr:hypothetical protein [Vibrio agarilyticus]NLS13404.1 hypothetical protein [Vibrio agarilyticus]
MTISSLQSGYQLLDTARQMSHQAARDINEVSLSSNGARSQAESEDALAFNRVEPTNESSKVNMLAANQSEAQNQNNAPTHDPLIALAQAERYNQIGTKIIERSNEQVGTLIDLHV